MSDHAADGLFRGGQYEEAAARLREGVKEQGENGRDLLLYLLDLGLSLHAAGKYEESNAVFLRAEGIADIKDYTSLAAETATLIVSENTQDYKGEDFEKVLINTYLAMNFALMGDLEGALVEARKVNRKLGLMVSEGQRKYKQNAFARYLSAVLYEAEGDYDDAYIDYKQTLELMPELGAGISGLNIGRDLWRMAYATKNFDDAKDWETRLNLTAEDREAAKALLPKAGQAEIVVLYENGIAPIKRPNPSFRSLPQFYPRLNPVGGAQVQVDGARAGDTALLHDIEATAIANLDEKYGGIIAKKIGGFVAKELVADQIERQTNNAALGLVARLLFHAGDSADLRSWNLLPRDLQIARVTVAPGAHTVRVLPGGGGPSVEKSVQVAAGKKVFVNFRYAPP